MTQPSTAGPPYTCFDVAIEAHVAHVQLNCPDKLNAMGRAFWSELPAIVRDIDDNARARVIVLSSTGKHFSAGMDLEVFADAAALQPTAGQDPFVTNEAFRHLVTFEATRAVLEHDELHQLLGGGATAARVIERLVAWRVAASTVAVTVSPTAKELRPNRCGCRS